MLAVDPAARVRGARCPGRAGGHEGEATGDTGPSPLLAEVGRKADLFIVEGTDRHQRADVSAAPDGPAFHLDACEAGAAAHAAGAARLLLTHFWPGNDREASRSAAEQEFDGEVLVADEGLVVEL